MIPNNRTIYGRDMGDAMYLRTMARSAREIVGHTKEGAEHADRLEAIARRLETEIPAEGGSR